MTEDRSLDEPLVLQSARDGVATLTLNSPANFNALSSAMIAALHAAINDVGSRSDVRVVVLAASGKAFCAGHDLREMRAQKEQTWHRALFERCSEMMMAIEALPQPVIAKVQGVATAAGCQLVASCDLAIASEAAKFATSGINLGLFCSTPAVAITQSMHAKHAAALLFTGEFIDAETAARLGLINKVVPAIELDATVKTLSQTIATQSGHAVRSGKALLRAMRGANSQRDRYSLAAENMAKDMGSDDAGIGISAFLNKKSRPAWRNR